MPVANVNGQHINYSDTGGDGPVIIWSHGFLMNHTMFAAQIDALSNEYRCISWDQRGFGATPVNGPFSFWESADDAVALLDHLCIHRAVFAGMSQGGFISMRAALSHPERVGGLILMDTQSGLDEPIIDQERRDMLERWMRGESTSELMRFVGSFILGDEDLVRHWIPIWEANRLCFSVHAADCLLGRDDISNRLHEITAPTLVIHGDADAATPVECGRHLADNIPNATMTVILGGSHAANLTNPKECNAAIQDFLDGLAVCPA
eukprot:Lankesteria_metandrocarpae@DN3613_c0_g1_i1.p1